MTGPRQSVRLGVRRIVALAFLTLSSVALTSGRASTGSPDFLAGTWVLQAAYEIQPDGKFSYPYGMKPQGILMVDSEGRYAVEIFGDVRPKFPSKTPTPEQYETAFLSISVHTGTVEVDGPNHLLIFHVAHNANPDRDMTVQERPYELRDDVLTYRVPAAAEGKINTPVSVWKRVNLRSERADRPDPSDKNALDR